MFNRLSGNPLLCQEDRNQCTKSESESSKRIIIGLTIAGGIVVLLLSYIAATIIGRRLKRSKAAGVYI